MSETQHPAGSDVAAHDREAAELTPPLQVLEDDETVPPRPEEELADLERSEPDPH